MRCWLELRCSYPHLPQCMPGCYMPTHKPTPFYMGQVEQSPSAFFLCQSSSSSPPQHHPSPLPWALSCRLWDAREVSLKSSLWMQVYCFLTVTWGQVGNLCTVIQRCIIYGYKGGFDKDLNFLLCSLHAIYIQESLSEFSPGHSLTLAPISRGKPYLAKFLNSVTKERQHLLL